MKYCYLIFLIAFVIAVLPISGFSQQPQFSTYKWTKGQYANGSTIADLNSDGLTDLIQIGSSLNVYINKGNGEFSSTLGGGGSGSGFKAITPFKLVTGGYTYYTAVDENTDQAFFYAIGASTSVQYGSMATGSGPTAVCAADFNEDGKTDIAIANSGSNNISLTMGTGALPYTSPISIATGKKPSGITAGDFNGDSHSDFSVINFDDNTILVYYGQGNGSFDAPVNISTESRPAFIVAGDFNKDGRDDLSIMHTGTPSEDSKISIFLSNVSGNPISSQVFSFGNITPNITCSDVDGDGWEDLLLGSTDEYIRILKGNSGTFALEEKRFCAVNVNQGFVYAAKLDKDTITDLLVSGDDVFSILGKNSQSYYTPSFFASKDGVDEYVKEDFNKDGVPDILFSQWDTLGVYIGLGNGNLSSPKYFAIPNGQLARAITTGDLNKDGNPDAVVVTDDFHSPAFMFVFLGDGFGNFSLNYSTSIQMEPGDVLTEDFNNDGNKDVIILHRYPNSASSNITVWLGNGLGGFSGTVNSLSGSNYPSKVCAADFNKDGKVDIALLNFTTSLNYINNISVSLGTGTGEFTFLKSFYIGDAPTDIETADLNKDGNVDFVATAYERGFYSFLGDGMGGFTKIEHPLYQISVEGININDFNGDQVPDIAMGGGAAPNLNIFTGYGDGNFADPVSIQTGNYTTHNDLLISGDFNSDGKPDIFLDVVGNNNDVAILENITKPVVTIEPNVSATDLYFTNVNPTSMTVNWTNGNGAARMLILRPSLPVNKIPLNGYQYSTASSLGDSNLVVYVGTNNNFTVAGLNPNRTYFFALYEFNGSNETTSYLTSPLSGSQVTPQCLYVSPLSATTFCGGDIVSVAFTSTITYPPYNTFTVYLSDANGNFDPHFSNLGTTSPLQFTLPNIPGSKYRIRVQATFPNTISGDNGSDITILYKPLNDRQLVGQSICGSQNGSITVKESETGINYSAYIGTTLIGSPVVGTGGDIQLTIPSLNLNSGINTIIVKANSGNCEVTLSSSAVINVLPSLDVSYSVSGQAVCPAASGTISVSGSQLNVSYQLYNNGTSIGSSVLGTGNSLNFNLNSQDLVNNMNVYEVHVSAPGCAGAIILDTAMVAGCIASGNKKPIIAMENVVIYPNPAKNFIRINLNDPLANAIQITIKNILGQTVFLENLHASSSIVSMDLPDLISGNYIVQISYNGHLINKKLVLE